MQWSASCHRGKCKPRGTALCLDHTPWSPDPREPPILVCLGSSLPLGVLSASLFPLFPLHFGFQPLVSLVQFSQPQHPPPSPPHQYHTRKRGSLSPLHLSRVCPGKSEALPVESAECLQSPAHNCQCRQEGETQTRGRACRGSTLLGFLVQYFAPSPLPLPRPVTRKASQDDLSIFPQSLGFEGYVGVFQA